MTRMLVTAARCPLMRAPSPTCEQVDELLLGWEAEALERAAPGWYRVRSAYGYEGFAPAAALRACPDGSAGFAALPKRVVTAPFCILLAESKVQSWPVAEAPRGALLAPLTAPDGDGWIKAALPDGREGCTKCGCLGERDRQNLPEAEFRRGVAGAALSYLDAPYRWGGKSPQGIDCSGLAFMAYWLNGVTIFRDARMEEGFPVREIPRAQAGVGDLLYFPGHVAVYLGDGKYVHSTARNGSDGVVINSLNPADAGYREDLAQSLTAVGSIF